MDASIHVVYDLDLKQDWNLCHIWYIFFSNLLSNVAVIPSGRTNSKEFPLLLVVILPSCLADIDLTSAINKRFSPVELLLTSVNLGDV